MSAISPISGQGPLAQAMATAASGMQAQAVRMRIVAENLANAHSTSASPGGDPYQRKLVSFQQVVDKATGAELVQPTSITLDPTPFHLEYDPSHPAANAQGYYKQPNVSDVVESADAREAQRSYEADLASLTQTRSMYAKTLAILKA